jgi:uncharacterized MnhB-related membrane protein
VIGGLMVLVTYRIKEKRRLGIMLALLILLHILSLYLLLVFTRYNAPDVRFNQFVVGGVIGLIFMMVALHRQSKLE